MCRRLQGLRDKRRWRRFQLEDALCHIGNDAVTVRIDMMFRYVSSHIPCKIIQHSAPPSGLPYQYLELSLQIHHIHQLYTTFIYWVVIIVCKEIWYYVRTDKTTFFIEWYCQWTIARSNLQNSILSAVFLDDKVNQSFCIAFALMFWNCCNVLNFKHTISFAGYDTFAFNSIIIEDIHPAIIKIAIYHVFLLISQ